MIPLLTLVAYYAPPGQRATWFALMASFMNLALVAGQLQTKYLNQIFTVERGAYGELGVLLIAATAIAFILPVSGDRAVRQTSVSGNAAAHSSVFETDNLAGGRLLGPFGRRLHGAARLRRNEQQRTVRFFEQHVSDRTERQPYLPACGFRPSPRGRLLRAWRPSGLHRRHRRRCGHRT